MQMGIIYWFVKDFSAVTSILNIPKITVFHGIRYVMVSGNVLLGQMRNTVTGQIAQGSISVTIQQSV